MRISRTRWSRCHHLALMIILPHLLKQHIWSRRKDVGYEQRTRKTKRGDEEKFVLLDMIDWTGTEVLFELYE